MKDMNTRRERKQRQAKKTAKEWSEYTGCDGYYWCKYYSRGAKHYLTPLYLVNFLG